MIRFGICGCGRFVEKAILPVMQKVKNTQVVAAFNTNEIKLKRVCDSFDIRLCKTYEELLAIDEIDVVYIASPNVFHKSQTIGAAKSGKHVFCEKPLGMNAVECKEMITTCKKNNVKLGVGFCYRFGGAQRRARQMIKDGVIGEVSYIYLSFNIFGYNPETAGWRCNPKMSGGGPLTDLAPHMIDLACFFLDDKVKSVMAYVEPPMTDTQIETDVLALMEFTNGARASLDTSFARRGNTHNYTIVGSKGEIHGVGTMPWLTNGQKIGKLFCEENHLPMKEVDFSTDEHIEEEIHLYSQAIEKRKDVPVPGEAGLHVQAVIDAIYESGRTGRRCDVKY